MSEWFIPKKLKEDAIHWIITSNKIINKSEIKNVKEKTEFIYRDIVEKKGYIAGIQRNICMCGRKHNEFAIIKPELLEKEEWKDKERISVICKECQELFLLVSSLYTIEKAKKVMEVLFEQKFDDEFIKRNIS